MCRWGMPVPSDQEVVIVREGTTKRWTLSLRGHLWYLKLKQMAAAQTEPRCVAVEAAAALMMSSFFFMPFFRKESCAAVNCDF